MQMTFIGAAASGIVTAAILSIATPSSAESAAPSPAAAVSEGQRITKADLRIKTDAHLVPAHVCPDEDAEKYEDCVPWPQVGESAIFVFPAAK